MPLLIAHALLSRDAQRQRAQVEAQAMRLLAAISDLDDPEATMPDWARLWEVGGPTLLALVLLGAFALGLIVRELLLLALRVKLSPSNLPILAVLAAVAPLLGLLGTVSGLVDIFVRNVNSGAIAGGIAQALLTTQVGLCIALPCLLARQLLLRWRERRFAAALVAKQRWRRHEPPAPLRQFSSDGDEARVDMAPLIDVVFLLLIFYVVAATFVQPTAVPIQRPQRQPGAALPERPLVITLAADGNAWIGDESWRPSDLLSLRQRLSGHPTQRIFLQSDAQIPAGELVRVIDACRAAGAISVDLAADQGQMR